MRKVTAGPQDSEHAPTINQQHWSCFTLSCVRQVPDPPQVTAVATDPPPNLLLQCGSLFISNPVTAFPSLLRSSTNYRACIPRLAQLDCCAATPSRWWRSAFVMTSFDRKRVLIGGNTADAMDMHGSQCNVEPKQIEAFSFLLDYYYYYCYYYCISYCRLVVSLVFKGGLKSIFINTGWIYVDQQPLKSLFSFVQT